MQMDIDMSVSVDVNNCHGSCMSTLQSSNPDTHDLPLKNPENDMTEFHNIQDDVGRVPTSNPPYDEYDYKCSTFPCSSKTTPSAETSVEATLVQESTPHDYNSKSTVPSCSHSSSLPPVSAMKGSREKRGVTPPQKLTVKWDPDVYDPIPTSVSHAPNNKPQRKSKKSKSKQKTGGKSSRGNKNKDKSAGKRGGG